MSHPVRCTSLFFRLLLLLWISLLLSSSSSVLAEETTVDNADPSETPSSMPLLVRGENYFFRGGGAKNKSVTTKVPLPGGFGSIKEKVEDNREQIHKDANSAYCRLQKTLKNERRRFRKRIYRDVLSQRVGWNWVRHTVRNHLGVVLGCWLVFRGNTDPLLVTSGGSVAIQTARIGWNVLDTSQILPHEPWLQDASSIVIGLFMWKKLLPRMAEQVAASLPPLLLGVSLFQCWGLVLDAWNENSKDEDDAPVLSIVVAVALSFLGLRAGKISVPLAASSLSGAILVYESALAEVAGNWVSMLSVATRVGLRLLRMVRIVLPLARNLLSLISRGAKFVWKMRSSSLAKLTERIGSTLKSCWSTFKDFKKRAFAPINELKAYVVNLPVTQSLRRFLQQLRKAMRRIFWPVAIATLGVCVQMEYVTGLGSMLRVFKIVVDPFSFAKKKVESFFNVESRTRQAIMSFSRKAASHAAGSVKSKRIPK